MSIPDTIESLFDVIDDGVVESAHGRIGESLFWSMHDRIVFLLERRGLASPLFAVDVLDDKIDA